LDPKKREGVVNPKPQKGNALELVTKREVCEPKDETPSSKNGMRKFIRGGWWGE